MAVRSFSLWLIPGSPGVGELKGGCPSCGPEKERTAAPEESAAPGPILGPAALLVEPEPQTPSSALRGRRGMAIMEPRRLEAWREFSRRLRVWAFIEAGV